MPESEKVRSHVLPEDRAFSFRLDDISLGVNDKLPFSANFSTDSLSSHHNWLCKEWGSAGMTGENVEEHFSNRSFSSSQCGQFRSQSPVWADHLCPPTRETISGYENAGLPA
jgi:hypothetical protein